MSIRRVLRGEALGYVKSGLYAATGLARNPWLRPRPRPQPAEGSLGVLFVHGVGANGTQFRALEAALSGAADHLDVFEYWSNERFDRVLTDLSAHLERSELESLIVVGHSLGGLLLRMLLQRDPPPPRIAGFISICAPLHGTRWARLGFSRDLREIGPASPRILELQATRARLERWRGSILTIGSMRDHFVSPASSAFLEEHATLRLEDVGHVGSLFDPRVHDAIKRFVAERRAVRT